MPKGTFTRVESSTLRKLAKMPWAVSGRRYMVIESSALAPICVSNISLNGIGWVNWPTAPQFGQTLLLRSCSCAFGGVDRDVLGMLGRLLGVLVFQVVDAGSRVALLAFGDQVGELVGVPGGLPDQRVHQDAAIQADDVVAHLHDVLPPGVA